MSDYVECPMFLTGSVISPEAEALGLKPNTTCGNHCPILIEAPVMQFICPTGHAFVAGSEDVIRGASS